MSLEDVTNNWLQPPDNKIDFEVDGDITIFRSEYGDINVRAIGRVTEDGFIGDWFGDVYDSMDVEYSYVDEYLATLEPSDFENIVVHTE